MTPSSREEASDLPQDSTQGGTGHADTNTEQQERAMTLSSFIRSPSQRALRTCLLLLLTLAAGWTDALSYLTVDRVFASFVTGSMLFVGISIAQRNTALLVRAGAAILLLLVGITFGSRCLQLLPARQSAGYWRRALARYLLGEGLVLLAFALVWSLVGQLAPHPAVQIILLGMGAFGMGLQGALLGAFNIVDVNTVAMTATELPFGIRLAQRIGRQSVRQPAGTSAPFLATLMLSYTLAALGFTLAMPIHGMAFVPCLLVAGAVVVLAIPARRGA
jgi:uncharacterized membrane protein YoaK (UPF0700 family)